MYNKNYKIDFIENIKKNVVYKGYIVIIKNIF